LANRHLRAARLYGVSFVALFTLALTALLGQLVGAFADSAESFNPYFDSTLERLQHGLGAYLLVASGLAFLGFAVRATAGLVEASAANTEVQTAGYVAAVFASLVGVAAAALATVSLSIGFGQITGDPGIRDGEELLPQLGYVVLAVPAAVSAAFSIWLLARLADSEVAALGHHRRVCRRSTPAVQLLFAAAFPSALVGAGRKHQFPRITSHLSGATRPPEVRSDNVPERSLPIAQSGLP